MTDWAAACDALAGAGRLHVPLHASPHVPWLAPYRACGHGVARDVMAGRAVHEALNAALVDRPAMAHGTHRLQFVAQQALPEGEAYEAFIARTGCVPTRDNLHDFFNGLVWLRFGRLKRQLNTLHAEQIARSGIHPTRGPVRDALTLFDENAALLQAPAVLVDALGLRDWQALFVRHRAAWQDARLTLVGHALLEKLMQPRKAITAHVWVLPQWFDLESLAEGSSPQHTFPADMLSPRWLADNPHLALPVLGVPGWWAANEDGNFYRDESVFRPALARPAQLQQNPPAAGL